MVDDTEVRRIGRALRTLRAANQVLVRSAEEYELLQGVCQALVGDSAYRMAWVGYAEHDPERTVRPVGHSGIDRGDLESLCITWDDSDHGRGPTGDAIRTGEIAKSGHIDQDPAFAALRDRATLNGFESGIALPLRIDGEVFGALNIYAGEPEAFDETETGILQALADDVAYGVRALREAERRRAVEHALKESEERYRALVEDQEELICRFLPDTTLVFVNGAYARFFGSRPDALVGTRFADFLDPETMETTLAHLKEFTPAEPFAQNEQPTVSADRRTRWHLWSNRAFFKADGTVAYFQAIGTDITDRKAAADALKESEARYRQLFNESPTPIYVVDPETTKPLLYNEPLLSVLGYTRDEFADVPIAAYEARETPEETRARIQDILDSGRTEFETVWRTKIGEIRNVVINVQLLEMEGRPVFHNVVTDLTDRIRAERKVRELQEELLQVSRINELGQMVSALAHELKQPLTASLNYINAFRRSIEAAGGAEPSRAIELSRKAGEQIDRAVSIIASLRELAQRRPTARTSEDVNAVVREAASLALTDSAVREIDVRFDLAADLPPATVDKVQIQQVVFNLIRNAVEAMSDTQIRDLVVESARSRDGTIRISVRDTGHGLPNEVAERLFQPFVTTKAQGMGMGLSISHSIIEAHAGKLWAEANPEGGTTFRFELPTKAEQA